MTYDGEICEDCGFPVRHFTGSWWSASDSLWHAVVGEGDFPILCPPCFTRRADALHIIVYWQPVESR